MKKAPDNRWKNILSERKFLFLFSVTAMVIICALLFIYRHENNTVHQYKRSSFNEDAIVSVKYNLESISADKSGNETIKGWFVLPGATYDFYNYGNDANRSSVYNYLNVCLVEGDDVYVLPTKLEGRSDVNDTIGDGIDYKYAGFQAWLPYRYSFLSDKCSFAFLTQNPDGVKTLYVQE